jgi:hypothetical protein
MFTPSPRAGAVQRVCGAACRVVRDRKLARARRRRELVDYRAEERERQQTCRQKRSAAECHAPPSALKSSKTQDEIARLVDRALRLSRARLVRDLGVALLVLSVFLATAWRASRASFAARGAEIVGESDRFVATRHA